MTPRSDRLALAALIAAGLVLRAWGITFGLPFTYHFDESNYMLTAHSFSLERFHPLYGPLFGPLQVLVIAERAVLGPLLEALGGVAPPRLAATLGSPVAVSHLLGRWTSAVAGALTALPLYLLGRRLWGRRVGLLAALFLTTCFLHVRSSHYGVPDALAGLFAVTAAWLSVRLVATRSWADYLGAGVAVGLAVAAKLFAWPLAVFLAGCHLLAPSRPADGGAARRLLARLLDPRAWASGVVVVAVALLAMPQVVLQWDAVLAFYRYSARLGAAGGLGPFRLDPGGPLGTYLEAFRWGLGTPLTLLVATGVLWVAVRPPRREALLLLAVPVLHLAFLFRPGNTFHSRYVLLSVPFLLLFAAALLVHLHTLLRGAARRVATPLTAALVVLAVAPPLAATVRHDHLLTRTDTRTLAKRWIERNVPEGSLIVLEVPGFSPQLASEKRPAPLSRRTYRVVAKQILGLSAWRESSPAELGSASVEAYRRAGVDYLISNGFTAGWPMIDPAQDRAKRAFYASLADEAELVAAFRPWSAGEPVPFRVTQTYGPATHLARYERPGPEIRIYALRPGGGP